MNEKKHLKKGFTFVELLLYMAIMSIVLTSMTMLAWNAIGAGAKNSTLQEVYSNARYVSERIKYEIRNASALGTVGASSLAYTDANSVSSTIALSGGNVQLTKGSSVNLNSPDTTVDSLVFTNYSSLDSKTKHVGFTMTMRANYSGARFEFKETISLRGSAELRSN